jgi:hypothetical protein
MHKGMIEENVSPKSWEERKREAEEFKAHLWSLIEAAHKKGMPYLTDEEFDEIWAEERAGGEGFNRVWNY